MKFFICIDKMRKIYFDFFAIKIFQNFFKKKSFFLKTINFNKNLRNIDEIFENLSKIAERLISILPAIKANY